MTNAHNSDSTKTMNKVCGFTWPRGMRGSRNPAIYIGGFIAALNCDLIAGKGITHIVKMFGDNECDCAYNHKHDNVKYLVVDTIDHPDFPIENYFAIVVEFIDRAIRSNGRVLVHCRAGISRSTTMVLAYLMTRQKMSLEAAWRLCKPHRPIIAPNRGFWDKLLLLQQNLNHST